MPTDEISCHLTDMVGFHSADDIGCQPTDEVGFQHTVEFGCQPTDEGCRLADKGWLSAY